MNDELDYMLFVIFRSIIATLERQHCKDNKKQIKERRNGKNNTNESFLRTSLRFFLFVVFCCFFLSMLLFLLLLSQQNSTKMKKAYILLLALVLALPGNARTLRLLYWNIQNGMWADQGYNYDNFVHFVDSLKPDICVWCEAASIFQTDSDKALPSTDDKYLPYNWDELALRYGHPYVYLGGWHDNYPQVITSRYPIRNVKRLLNSEDGSVSIAHGASWAQLDLQGQTVNIVTLHTWPMGYDRDADDRKASAAEGGGDKYRRREIEAICSQTILTHPDAANEYWLMMGDFNSPSRVDSAHYNYPSNSTKYLTLDYVREQTPYLDIIAEKHLGEFHQSIAGERRIDFVCCTPAFYRCISEAHIIPQDPSGWLNLQSANLSNFNYPSDHLPILVDFNLKHRK